MLSRLTVGKAEELPSRGLACGHVHHELIGGQTSKANSYQKLGSRRRHGFGSAGDVRENTL
jgi:hypothetical protein